jgi:hypothetical protein
MPRQATDQEKAVFGRDVEIGDDDKPIERGVGSLYQRGLIEQNRQKTEAAMKAAEPLTALEKLVFGADAKRGPDGAVLEQGIGARVNPTPSAAIDPEPSPPPASAAVVPPGRMPGLWAPGSDTVQ